FNIVPGVRLFICGRLVTDKFTNLTPNSHTYMESQAPSNNNPDGHGIEFAPGGPGSGDIVVPHAGFHIGSGGSSGNSVDGHIWAENVDLEHAVNVTTPSTTTTTTSSTSTSTSTSSTSTSSTSTSTSSTSTTAPTTTT